MERLLKYVGLLLSEESWINRVNANVIFVIANLFIIVCSATKPDTTRSLSKSFKVVSVEIAYVYL